MKRIALAVAVSAALIAGHASAHDASAIGGGIVVGGQLTGYTGSISGSASSISNGEAVTSAQTNGFGSSNQFASNSNGGTASIGGTVTPLGANVSTASTQFSHSVTTGSVTGNSPITDSNGALLNAGNAFGDTKTAAIGSANFAQGSIGAVGAIGGAAGVFAVGGIH